MTINVKNFLKDKPRMSKMGEFQELQPIEGLEISAVSADLYGTGRDDLCLFYFKDGANYAALYTNNSICSESITWNRKIRKKFIKANKKISNLNNSYGNWNLMFNIEKGELKEIFDSGKHKSQITYRCLTY